MLKAAWIICALAAAETAFGQEAAEEALACEVQPLAPALTYRLVYRAGYSVTLPMSQFAGRGVNLTVQVRVTPQRAGFPPLLLEYPANIPASPDGQARDSGKLEAQVQGQFYLGAGAYHAALVLTDDHRRVCRKEWDLEVKVRKDAGTALAPGQAVDPAQLAGPQRKAGTGSATVFVNAGPPRANPVLLAALAALLDRMAFGHVEIVVFSLDQRKELLRQVLTPETGLRPAAEALHNYNPGIVSYEVLKDPAGHQGFLRQLMVRETQRQPPPDALFFMGFPALDDAHVSAPPTGEGSQKPFYAYLNFAPPGSRRIAVPLMTRRRGRIRPEVAPREPVPSLPEMPDAISRMVRASAGNVYPIHSPADLASALRKIAERLRR